MVRRKYILSSILVALVIFSAASATFPLVKAEQKKEVVLYTHGWWQPYPRNRYNPFAPRHIGLTGLVKERLAFWDKLNNKYVPWLAESWEFKENEKKVIIHLRKDVYWHDGQKFTAKDVWTTLMLYKLFNRPLWKYISDVKVIDDYTVEYDVKEWSYLLPYYLLYKDAEIAAPYHIYGKFADQVAKAQSESELNNIRTELIKFEPKTVLGTGPFKFVKITSSEVILTKFDKHWAADKIKIDKIVLPYITANEVGWLYYRSGQLDYDCFMMPSAVYEEIKKLPFAEVVNVYDLSGFALVYNFKNPYLKDLRVRQAIAYVIDRKKAAQAAGGPAFDPTDYPTGILKVVENQWIGDIKNYLNTYDTNPSKAEELLKQAGFTKKGGKWYTPDGKVFKLSFVVPGGYTDWVAAAKEITNELKNFGIDVELRTPESSSYWSEDWYLGGNYDLAFDFFGAWMTYPWAAFNRIFIEVNDRPKSQIQGQDFEKFFENVNLGGPFSGTANAMQLTEKLAVIWDPKEQKETAQKLAWIVNHYLPIFPIAEKQLMLYYNVQHFKWPEPKTHFNLWQAAAGGHQEALGWMIINGYIQPNPSYWEATTSTPAPTTIVKTETQVKTETVTKTATATGTSTSAKTCGPAALVALAVIPLLMRRRRR